LGLRASGVPQRQNLPASYLIPGCQSWDLIRPTVFRNLAAISDFAIFSVNNLNSATSACVAAGDFFEFLYFLHFMKRFSDERA
jgi:hypothetical protein